ncbi:hypothetical protein LX36DRAFT_650786 [Colletotrichum falcatum]|nr:hypothetical protein LX36DRAFT_650786 [Colletotrichum falcatum]
MGGGRQGGWPFLPYVALSAFRMMQLILTSDLSRPIESYLRRGRRQDARRKNSDKVPCIQTARNAGFLFLFLFHFYFPCQLPLRNETTKIKGKGGQERVKAGKVALPSRHRSSPGDQRRTTPQAYYRGQSTEVLRTNISYLGTHIVK